MTPHLISRSVLALLALSMACASEAGRATRTGPSKELLIVGYDLDEKAYIVRNSWGAGYGQNGYINIPFAVMERHAAAGADQVQDNTVRWQFDWVAPASDKRVVFHAAINVANNDASEFGDRIYTRIFHSGAERVLDRRGKTGD